MGTEAKTERVCKFCKLREHATVPIGSCFGRNVAGMPHEFVEPGAGEAAQPEPDWHAMYTQSQIELYHEREVVESLQAKLDKFRTVTDYARSASGSGPGDLQAYIEKLWSESLPSVPSPAPAHDERKLAEDEYTLTAFDYQRDPVGSRDWTLFWKGWQFRAKLGVPSPTEAKEPAPPSAEDVPLSSTPCKYHDPARMYCLDCIPDGAPLGVLLIGTRGPTPANERQVMPNDTTQLDVAGAASAQTRIVAPCCESPASCSNGQPHAAHTFGGRPMQLCKGIPKPDCDGKVTHPSGQCAICKAYHVACCESPVSLVTCDSIDLPHIQGGDGRYIPPHTCRNPKPWKLEAETAPCCESPDMGTCDAVNFRHKKYDHGHLKVKCENWRHVCSKEAKA